jgi:hypothetical protein
LATKVLEELLCWGVIKFSEYYGFLKISKYKNDEKFLYLFKTNKKGTKKRKCQVPLSLKKMRLDVVG